MDKITDISEFARRKLIVKQTTAHNYVIGEVGLVMDIQDQIEHIKDIAKSEALSPSVANRSASLNVLRLTRVLEYIFRGVHLPFGGASIYVLLEEGEGWSVSASHASLTELERVASVGGSGDEVQYSFKINALFLEKEETDVASGTLKVDDIRIAMPETSGVSPTAVRWLLKKANELALINKGVSFLTKTGVFFVILPYSPVSSIVIAIHGGVPFKLKEIAAPGK